MFRLKDLNILGSKADLALLPEGKLLINTINAHSFNTAKKDKLFAEALTNGDALIPDGVSIVKACRRIKAKSQPKERIAGWDLFEFEMNKLEQLGIRNEECGVDNSELDNSQSASADNSKLKIQNSKLGSRQLTVMFMGSSQKVLDLIVKRVAKVYPHLKVVTYSPSYKPEFSDEDNKAIIEAINAADPDLLWIGMTAPKQEKWMAQYGAATGAKLLLGLGGSLDVFAGVAQRAPEFYCKHNLEWFYRLIKNPSRAGRMMKLPLFLVHVAGEKRK